MPDLHRGPAVGRCECTSRRPLSVRLAQRGKGTHEFSFQRLARPERGHCIRCVEASGLMRGQAGGDGGVEAHDAKRPPTSFVATIATGRRGLAGWDCSH